MPISSNPSSKHFFLKGSISNLITAPLGLLISWDGRSISSSGFSISFESANKASLSSDETLIGKRPFLKELL